MIPLNPPTGFTSRDWSEDIRSDELTLKIPSKPGEVVPKEEPRLRGPIPIPVSGDGGKTLDWSRPVETESLAHASIYFNPTVHRE
jgi:hypothetical protein